MSAVRLLSRAHVRYFSGFAAATCAGVYTTRRQRSTVKLDSPPQNPSTAADELSTFSKRVQGHFEHHQDPEHATKKGDAEIISKANDPDTYGPGFEGDDENAWATFSRSFNTVREGIERIQWTAVGDKITDFVVPSWAKFLPEGLEKLRFELSMQPGTLADEIWQEAHDSSINPEILWNATVRVGDTLGKDELEFRRKRKEYIVKALAKYLDIDEAEIDPEDVPTIAVCGSGGGLRALVAGASSCLSAQKAGLFDCVTYTAGVSGSCWLQAIYFSSLGKQNHATVLKHLKSRIGTHIAFPPTAMKLVLSAPTNKYILSGFVEKLKGDPGANFGLVDIYGGLLAARLMVPNGDLDVHDQDLKLSNQRIYLENGEHPMPIYTAVRHEIPVDEEELEEAKTNLALKQEVKEKARKEAWFQWFEMQPWEVWCEEFGAGIPTWAFGRPFRNGQNQILETGVALPEVRQSLLLGIWGSAFCATLSHYYKEIKPLLLGMVGFAGVNELLEGKNDDLIKIHPIEPATIPNFVYGMKDQLPSTCPESVFRSDHLQLMDAGMSNNLPIYPLLRPGRDVDILIAFDASADIQKENWLSIVDGYAKQRGIKGWPLGAGWPSKSSKPEETVQALEEAQATTPQEAATKIAEAREQDRQNKPSDDDSGSRRLPQSPTTGDSPDTKTQLTTCNVWVGTKEERTSEEEPPPSRLLGWDDPEDSTFHLTSPSAGIAVVYFPLLPNPKVEGVDPDKSDYLSTWNFIYTPEEIDKVAELAQTNFEEGADITKRTVRAVYERRRKERLEREAKLRSKALAAKVRQHGDSFAGS